MSDKIKVPLRFQVQVEERFHQPAHKRWRAQFSFYPLGWFRGDSHSPAAAVAIAWRNFRRAAFLILALLGVVALKRSGGGFLRGVLDGVAPPHPAPAVETTVHMRAEPGGR